MSKKMISFLQNEAYRAYEFALAKVLIELSPITRITNYCIKNYSQSCNKSYLIHNCVNSSNEKPKGDREQDYKRVKKRSFTPAVTFDSRTFNGHCLSSASETGGEGGFHRAK